MWLTHPEESCDVHAELARERNVLRGDVGLGAMCCDTNRADAQVVGLLELTNRPDPREEQCREPRIRDRLGSDLDPLPVGVAPGPVVEGSPSEAIAVGDLDRVDTGSVKCLDDAPDIVAFDAMAQCVHAVTERDVLDEQLGHSVTPRFVRVTSDSATLRAADVMMSRLPA